MEKVTNTTNDIIDLDFSPIRKQRFRIDGDDNKIISLNLSDMGLLTRLNDIYPKLFNILSKVKDTAAEVKQIPEDDEFDEEREDALNKFTDTLKDIDNEMKKMVDSIFNEPVADVFSTDGAMYDMVDGKFRFEHIIDRLLPLYGERYSAEAKKMKQRISEKTKGMIPTDHKKPTRKK